MSPANDSASAELGERLQFETLIADLSLKFINLPAAEVDREIMDAQRRICELLGLDFAALWQASDGEPGSFDLTHFYTAQVTPDPPARMRQDQYPWAREQLLAGRTIKVSSLKDLPPEAARDRETLSQFGIKSNLALPLSVGGESPVGLLGLGTTVAERAWPDDVVKRLQLVAQVFAHALARKRADWALRDSEERMSLAAEAAELGLWVWSIARDEVWGSPRWRELFGFTRTERVGFQQVLQRIHPDDRDAVERKVLRAVAHGGEYVGEFRVVLPDGTPRWITSRGRAHTEADRASSRMLGAAMDITERKRAEEAVRASQARLEAGTDLAGLGYYEVNYGEGTCFLDERFREICGVPPDLRQGLKPLEFWLAHIHPDDRQPLLDERRKLHEGTMDRISAEYRYVHPAHGQRWVHHLARRVGRSVTAGEVHTFGVIRDITQQKRAEMEARELRENLTHLARVNVLGALSGSLAHELNQPLGIILSNAQAAQELLAQEPPDVTEVQAILADIVAADRRAAGVIERLRAMLKHGCVPLQPLSLNQVIEEVLQLARADLIGRGITVVRALAAALPPVAGDRVQLQQLVLNLILNGADALAAKPPGARRLHLRTMRHHGRVRAAVRDEGVGLPAETERLFQAFYTTKPQGLGLGLAICRTIVEAHAGRIWAEPDPECGAAFFFELPIAPVGGEGARAEEETPS